MCFPYECPVKRAIEHERTITRLILGELLGHSTTIRSFFFFYFFFFPIRARIAAYGRENLIYIRSKKILHDV